MSCHDNNRCHKKLLQEAATKVCGLHFLLNIYFCRIKTVNIFFGITAKVGKTSIRYLSIIKQLPQQLKSNKNNDKIYQHFVSTGQQLTGDNKK